MQKQETFLQPLTCKTLAMRSHLEHRLSVQERKVLVAAALCNHAREFSFKDLHRQSRIFQSGHLSVIVTRLVKKSLFKKIGKGLYDFASEDLREYLRYRYCNQFGCWLGVKGCG
ncbi:MAG: hypothetical protein HC851_21580 [Acaryochloris sp. RU_4_1]|nr:hypothetical protein [Acaryochloris sp. RU_4_1]